MADSKDQRLRGELRARVGSFLAKDESPRRRALLSTIERIRVRKWNAVLFGGTLRDLMVYGLSKPPRDVDLVIADVTTDELANVFADSMSKRTRFGGLHLRSGGWMFDVWPLSETWAFRQLGYPALRHDFASLPRTTFLNVEAVAVEVATPHGKTRRIHSHGFFEALSNRTVEINFEDNPFPALCVVRSLVTAARLQFSIGPKLSQYLVHYSRIFSAEELVQVQISHYGYSKLSATEFRVWLAAVEDQYRAGAARAVGVRLPVAKSQQLELFRDRIPAW
jgi:hypothetical protein